MNKYLVYFTTIGGDYDNDYCYADDKQKAGEYIMREYPNVTSIDHVILLK